MAKIHVADTLNRAADIGVQLCGAQGYSKDTLLEWIYRYARCAKLVDGASEVHKMVLARSLAKEGNDFWSLGLDQQLPHRARAAAQSASVLMMPRWKRSRTTAATQAQAQGEPVEVAPVRYPWPEPAGAAPPCRTARAARTTATG